MARFVALALLLALTVSCAQELTRGAVIGKDEGQVIGSLSAAPAYYLEIRQAHGALVRYETVRVSRAEYDSCEVGAYWEAGFGC